MKKDRIVKILSFVLCLIILTGSLPITVIAEGVGEIYESVVNNDNSTPENDIPPADPGADDPQSDNVATGEIEVSADAFQLRLNADDKSYTVVGYLSSSNTMHIPSSHNGLPVTRIEEFAFQNKTNLEHVTIPDSIRYIGTEAFSGCVNIRTNDYGGACYIGNENNDHIYLLKARTETKADGFSTVVDENGAPLTEITVKDGTRFVGSYAFQNCNEITGISVPDSVIQIGFKAFRHMDGLERVSLPFCGETADGTQNTHFGYVFGAQTYGGNISYVPTGIREIRINGGSRLTGHAFYGIDFVETLALPFIDTYISSLFDGESYQDNIYIPTSLTRVEILGGDTIPAYAFYSCGGLDSIVISDSVQTIGDYAFYGCSGLTDVTVGSGVTSIGSRSFYNCIGLTDIVIPADMTEIADEAFYGCTGLFVVYNLSELPLVPGETSYGYVAYYAKLIYDSIEEAGEITTTEEGYTFALVEGTYYLIDYSGTAEELVLPDSFNGSSYEIYQDAFKGCNTLTAVTVPAGVTHIGKGAFADCSRLESITVPFVGASDNGMTNTHFGYIFGAASYSENAECVPIALKNVTITGGKIADNAFRDCSNLTNITMGDRVTSIGDSAFEDCSSLTSVTIGNGVTSIGDDAFSGCDGLKAVYITDIAAWCAIEFGGYYANPLYYAHNLYLNGELVADLAIPDSVTSIGSYAFSYCSSLTSVVIPDSVTSIGDEAFEDCSSLESVIIGNGVTSIGPGAFYNCSSLESVELPDSVKIIRSSAFYNCSSLTSIVIPDGVQTIGPSAFYNCSSLTSIVIPESVTLIESSAFYNCNSLAGVYITDIATWCKIDFWGSIANPLYYAHNLYLNGELVTDLVIPDGVASIGRYAFYNCSSLESVTIGDSVTSIGDDAFEDCSSLESVIIGNGVTSIGPGAFYNCSSLESVEIPDSVKIIRSSAFYNCSSLTSIVIPESVTLIESSAFYNCSSLTSIVIPESVTLIESSAFYNCSSLTSIVIPDSVTSIASSAFEGCSKLKYNEYDNAYYLGNENNPYMVLVKAVSKTITTCIVHQETRLILSSAFSSCSSLESITLPFVGERRDGSGKTHFGYIFGASSYSDNSSCVPESLKAVTITGGEKIGTYAFYNCRNLTSVVIPDSVTSIGDGAFSYCSSLTSVFIPDSVTSIGDWAFRGCNSLTMYCVATSKPSGWSSSWNPNNRPVVWGYEINKTVRADNISESNIAAVSFRRPKADNAVVMLSNNLLVPMSYTADHVELANAVSFSALPTEVKAVSYSTGADTTGESLSFALSSDGTYYIVSDCDGSYSQVVIPNTYNDLPVKSIGFSAFRDCSSLTSVTMGDSVTSIGYSAFYNCSSLEAVYITDIAAWCAIDFGDYYSNPLCYAHNLYLNGELVTDLVIPERVTSIGDSAFDGCSSLTSVVIPDSVTTIGSSAFSSCSSLTSVVIPDSVTTIGSSAFSSCSSLTSVVIPDSVTSIGDGAFRYCSSLESITLPFVGERKDGAGETHFGYIFGAWSYSYNSSYVPESLKEVTITGGEQIDDYAFYNCSSLTSVVIPDRVTSIGDYAFYNCSSLESITLPFVGERKDGSGETHFGYIFGASSYSYNSDYVPESLKSVIITGGKIDTSAFEDCSSLTSVTIGNGVTSIGYKAFYNCSSLTSVTMGDSVTSIGDYAFSGCSNLTNVTMGDSVTSIGYGAFSGCSNLTNVTMGDSVTSIGSYAFRDCSSLASIEIPDSVTSIGSYAFSYCSSLTSVVIPDSVTSIGESAFDGCDKLKYNTYDNAYYLGNENNPYMVLVEAVSQTINTCSINPATKLILYSAFSNCSSLTSVVIPDSVTSIGDSAFDGCSSLTSVVIPDRVTSIGDSAFYNCSSLTSVVIPDSVTSIGDSAFYRCSSLTSVVIHDSVTSIGDSAFYYCSSLTSVAIGNSVTSIGDYAFYNCSSLEAVYITDIAAWCAIDFGNYYANPLYHAHNLYLNGDLVTDLVIPDSVTSIGDYAFYYCSSLTSIEIPDSVTSIGSYAFVGCSKLKYNTYDHAYYLGNENNPYMVLVKSVSKTITTCCINPNAKLILYSAFVGCSSLTSVVIPDSVTSIGESAFENCSSLTSITIPFVGSSKDTTTNTHFGYIFGASSYSYNSDYVPESLKSVIITGGKIDTLAFYSCSSLESITIGNGFTSIGSAAFRDCSSLTSVVIPASVTSIGTYAFEYCSNLEAVYITDIAAWCAIEFGNSTANPLSYAHNLYLNGELVTDLVIPDGVTSIGSYAFRGYSGLISVTIGNGVTTINSSAFSGCSSLTSVTIENSITTIGDYAFSGCSSLTSVVIPASVTSIGSYAFYNCSSLTNIVIPDSVTSMGNYAFQNCSSLTSVVIPDSVTSIGYMAFYNCSSLTSVTIGNGVINIGSDAFRYCSSLTSIVIPDSVTNIGSGAFSKCTNLTSITIPFVGATKDGTKDTHFGYIFSDSFSDSYYVPKSLKSVIITGGNKIGSFAFEDCSSLESIVIPDSVTSIDYMAFYNCSSLTSIEIPDSVTSIDSSAFRGCSSLESITLPFVGEKKDGSGETHFGYIFGALSYSSNSSYVPESLKSVIITGGKIDTSAFYNCSSLESITIGNGVTSIGKDAFSGCSNLKYNIYEKAYYLGNENNPYLVLVKVVSESITTCSINPNTKLISYSAFSGCSNLESITLPFVGSGKDATTNTHFGYIFGASSYTGNTNAVPASLKTVVITGDGRISDYAFYGCGGIVKIVIPEGVTEIGTSAFENCISLQTISLPNTLLRISARALSNLNALEVIYYNGESLEWRFIAKIVDWDSGSGKGGSYTIRFKAPSGLLYEMSADGTEMYISEYDALMLGIGTEGIGKVVIPEKFANRPVTEIYREAFYNNMSVVSVSIPDSVSKIGQRAFSNCINLTVINIPDTVSVMESGIFSGCTSLGEMTVPFIGRSEDEADKSTAYLGYLFGAQSYAENAVFVPESLSTVTVSGNADIADYMYYGCSDLSEIIHAGTPAEIGAYAFSGCTDLSAFDVPESVIRIGDGAFEECTGLVAFIFPDLLEQCGVRIFEGCHNLEAITIGANFAGTSDERNGYTLWGLNKSASSLKTYIVSDQNNKYVADDYGILYEVLPVMYAGGSELVKVSVVDAPARSNLSNYSLPSHIVEIKQYAFSYNTSLTSIDLAYVRMIGRYAFYSATGLINVRFGTPDVVDEVFEEAVKDLVYITVDENNNVLQYYQYVNLGAFMGCTSLQSVNIDSEMLVGIGEQAFYDCTSLKNVTIGKHIQQIDAQAFGTSGIDGGSIEWFYVPESGSSDKPAYFKSIDGVLYRVNDDGTLTLAFFPANKTQLSDDKTQGYFTQYQNGKPVYATDFALPTADDSGHAVVVCGMENYALNNVRNIISVSLDPSCAFTMGDYALGGSIAQVYIGKHVVTLGEKRGEGEYSVFADCERLETITVDAANTYYCSVDGVLFDKDMSRLVKYPAMKDGALYHVPEEVRVIASMAFKDNKALNNIVISSYISAVGLEAFYNCSALRVIFFNDVYAPGAIMENAFTTNFNEPYTIIGYSEGFYDGGSGTNDIGWSKYNAAYRVEELSEIPEIDTSAGNGFYAIVVVDENGNRINGVTDVGGQPVNTITVSLTDPNGVNETIYVGHDDTTGLGDGVATFYDLYGAVGLGLSIQFDEPYTLAIESLNGAYYSYVAEDIYLDIETRVTYVTLVEKPCELYFDANGGTSDTASVPYSVGISTALPNAAFTRPGYTLLGWSTTENGTVAYTEQYHTDVYHPYVILYAVWQANENTVEFNPNSDSVINSDAMADMSIHTDETLQLPANLYEREGFTFIGWSEVPNGTPVYTDGDMFTSGYQSVTTLYACWKGNENLLVFDPNGGQGSMGTMVVVSEETYVLDPVTFEKPGYTFDGWATAPEGDVRYEDAGEYTASIAPVQYLYAVWHANSNTIVFDANGGFGEMEVQSGNTDAEIVLQASAFTRNGYVQIGWSTEKDGTLAYRNKASYTVGPEGVVTLYAVWAKMATVYGVSFDETDINSQKIVVNKAEYGDIPGSVTLKNPSKGYTEDNIIYGDMAPETVTVSVVTYFDVENMYIQSAFLMQNGKEVPLVQTREDFPECGYQLQKNSDSYTVTFLLAAEDLVPEVALECRVAVAAYEGDIENPELSEGAPGSNTYASSFLNIDIIDFTLEESDVKLDTGDLSANFGGVDLLMQIFDGSLNMSVGDNVDVSIVASGDTVTFSLNASAAKDFAGEKSSYTTNYEKGYRDNIEPSSGNTWRFTMLPVSIDGELYMGCVYFARGTQSEGYYYYRCSIKDLYDNEKAVFYGLVNSKTGRSGCAAKVAAILNTYALTVEDGDFGSGTAYYELPPQSYSFKSSGSVKLSLYGDIVTKYDMRTGLVPVSSTVKGAVSFHLEVEGQFTVVVIPVVVGFTVDASGELTLNIGYDDSEGIRIQNLSGEVILEITATAGIGLKRIASLGVYGSAKLEWLFELYPQVYTKRLTVSGKVGAYVQFLWWEYRRDFLNMSKDLINNEPGTMAQLAAMETAALYLMENYTPVAPEEYSEYAQLAVVNGKMYKLHYVSAYNTSGTAVTKLAVSVLDISSGAWSEPVIIEDNGLTDAEFTLFETNDGIYLLYKQEKENASGEVEIKDYVSNIDVKLVRFDDSMNPQESVSVIGNGGYQYMTALAVVDGTLTMAWAENSDNNVFGVSPYNYIDSNGISHISPTSANSVWVKQFIDGKWQEAKRVANGLSAITDLAISESGHILYIVDENGDLSNSDDRVAYDYSFAYDATATLNPDAPGTISNLKAIDGNLLYTVIGEEKNQVVVYDANGKAITLPENIAEVSDNYRILYKDGEVAAVVFSENISWEENGETQNADAVRGMFRNDGSWGDIVTITVKRANTYITAFDAELDPNNDDTLIVTADLIDDEGNVLGSVTEHCVLKSNIVCREYAVDYETRTITYTIANTGARDTDVYAVIHDGGQVGGSGNKVHLASGLKSGTEETFSVYLYEFFMSSDVGNISIYDSGTGEEIYRHSVDLNFSDLKPYAKQLHVGDKDMMLVAVENSGNTANGGTLYVKLGNCSIEEVMTDSYAITIHSIGAGAVSYCEIPVEALTRDSTGIEGSIVTLYIEESIAIEKSDKGENNLAYTTFEEYTSKVAEDGSSYTASIGVPVVTYDRAIHTDLTIAYSVSEGHAVTAIRIDGTAVEPGNYDILDNQIILYKSFVEGLAGGTRTMTIVFSNGESCEVQLKVLQYYTVKWYNTDHENPIYSSIVKAGAIPSCAITPFKAADNRYEYHFIGWSVTPGGTVSAVEAISEDSPTAYYAVYEAVERSCTVTWVVDGKENHETYSFGTTAENVIFNGNTEKASDELYRYTFAGWDKEISDVTGDAIYTAVYNKERITLGEATVSFSDFTTASGKTFTTSLLIGNIDNITRTTIKLKYNPDIVTFIDIIPCEYVEVAEYGASYLLLDIRLPDEATVLSLADISFKANETLTPGAYDFLNIECEDTLVSELCQVEIYEQGDVNMDGIVNTRDLAILRQYIVGLSALDFVQLSYANVYEDFDLNGVPIVNTRDIAVLQQYIVGIIDSV